LLRISHQAETGQARTEDIDANVVRLLSAGDRHFLTFVLADTQGYEDLRLLLPADTVYRVEKIS
jgi:hypothetical protein